MGSKRIMILFLFGADTYSSKKRLKEIIEEYKKCSQIGLGFIKIKPGENSLNDLKKSVETVSMFDEKK